MQVEGLTHELEALRAQLRQVEADRAFQVTDAGVCWRMLTYADVC
jgi:hypothetical protein